MMAYYLLPAASNPVSNVVILGLCGKQAQLARLAKRQPTGLHVL
jgi:hypothetical protein